MLRADAARFMVEELNSKNIELSEMLARERAAGSDGSELEARLRNINTALEQKLKEERGVRGSIEVKLVEAMAAKSAGETAIDELARLQNSAEQNMVLEAEARKAVEQNLQQTELKLSLSEKSVEEAVKAMHEAEELLFKVRSAEQQDGPSMVEQSAVGPLFAANERPGQTFLEGTWSVSILDAAFEHLVRKEDPQLFSNLFRIPMNEDGPRTRIGTQPAHTGIERMAASAIAVIANGLHGPPVFLNLVALAAIEPFLVLWTIERLRDVKEMIEIHARIFFEIGRPARSRGRFARSLKDCQLNRRMMRTEVARVRQVGIRKLRRQVAVATDAIRCALIRERDLPSAMFEVAIGAGHRGEFWHRPICLSMPAHVDVAAGTGFIRHATE